MSLSYVGGTAAATSSVSLPTFAEGDIALCLAYRDGSNSPPGLPSSGWTGIAASGANNNSSRLGYRVLQGGETTTGTWANATEVQVVILRGQHSAAPIGANAPGGANNSNQLSYTGFTLSDTSGTSWIVGMAGHGTATNVNSKAVSGMTTRSNGVTSLGAHTAEGVSSFSTSPYTTTVNASSGWRSYAVEVIAANPTSTGTVRLSLEGGLDPGVDTGHQIRVRARASTGAGVLRASLYEGTADISGVLETSTLTATLADYTLALGTAAAASITSYADLELRLWGYAASGGAAVFEVGEAALLLPVPAAGEVQGASVLPLTFTSTTSGSSTSSGVTQTGVVRLSLESGYVPQSMDAHAISLRARKTLEADTGTIRAQLYEGGTPRTDWLESGTLGTAWATYDLAIGTAEAASITSYSNLELRLLGYSSAGTATVYQVAEASLSLAAPAGGAVEGAVYFTNSSSISTGDLVQPLYPGTAVYPHALVTCSSASSIAVAGSHSTQGIVSLPLSLGIYSAGSYPTTSREGAVAFAAAGTVTVAGSHEALGQLAIAASSSIAVTPPGSTSHEDSLSLTGTSSIVVAGEVSPPLYPPVPDPRGIPGMPEVLVAVAFPSTPWDGFPEYSDITPYLRSFSTQGGRQFELDRVEAGQMSLLLSNLDGRFSPENTGGPYYGDLVPTRRVKTQFVWKGYHNLNLVDDGSFESGAVPGSAGSAWNLGGAPVAVDSLPGTGYAVHPLSGGYRCYTAGQTTSSWLSSAKFIPVDTSQPYVLAHYVAQWDQLGVVDPNGTIRVLCYDEDHNLLGYVYPNETAPGVSYDSGLAITYTGAFVRWGGLYRGSAGVTGSNVGGFMAGTKYVKVEVWLQYSATTFAAGIGVVIDAISFHQGEVPLMFEDSETYVWTVADVFNGYVEGFPQEWPSLGFDSLVQQRAVDAFLALRFSKLIPASTTLSQPLAAQPTASTSENIAVGETGLPMPQAVPFTLTVGSEAMTVTAILDATTYRVTRGGENSAAHDAGATITSDAVSFGTELTGARVRNVLERIGMSPAQWDIEDGQTLLAPSQNLAGTDPLAHLNEVAEVEGGRFFAARDGKLTFLDRHHLFKVETSSRATLGDGAGELHYRDIRVTHEQERIYNIVRVTAADGTIAEVRDQASIDDHFERVLEKSWPLANPNEAWAAARYLLKRYSRMQVRIPELVFAGRSDPNNLWPVLLGMELGQRYRVVRRPSNDDPIDKELLVEGIAHSGTPSNIETRVQMSLADTTHYWRLGVTGYSELGSTTRVGY